MRRIITERDQRHGLVQAVGGPLQLINIVKGISAQDFLGLFHIFGKLLKQFRGAGEQLFQQLLLFFIEATLWFHFLKVAAFAIYALGHMLQKFGTEKQVIHLNIDIEL